MLPVFVFSVLERPFTFKIKTHIFINRKGNERFKAVRIGPALIVFIIIRRPFVDKLKKQFFPKLFLKLQFRCMSTAHRLTYVFINVAYLKRSVERQLISECCLNIVLIFSFYKICEKEVKKNTQTFSFITFPIYKEGSLNFEGEWSFENGKDKDWEQIYRSYLTFPLSTF